MTSLKGDLRSIMGTPFGGVGHAVLIFSRVTRAAFDSDSVILQLHDRIEMPEEADGKFQVDGLDPGPIRIELEGGAVHNHGWNIDLPDEGTWSLADLVDAQVDWSPAVIGRAEAAARDSRDHADRAEAAADRVGTAEQVGVWASEASASASNAASAESGAVTARDAAGSARDAAEGHANRAATSESNAAASESAAKQSETNAGDFAAVATTAATEAVDAMERATEIAGGNVATQSDLSNAVANSLSVDTTLATWTADAVGGRNLVRKTTTAPTEKHLSETIYYWELGTGVKLEAGVEYTFSVIIDKISDDDTTVGIELGLGNGRNYLTDLPGVRHSTIPYGERVTLTFIPTEDKLIEGERDQLSWRIRNARKAVTVAYRELKLERGPVATPWTPSPEDSVQSLSEGNSLPSPFPAHNPALALRVDNSVGTRVFMGDVMIYGDTGWRDISADISDRESGRLLIRRIGEQVFVAADALKLTSTGSVTIPRLRVNFYPISRVRGTWNESLSGSTAQGSYNISNTGYFNIYGVGSGPIEINETYLTDRVWPTALPGIPA